jgi:hypothetical protein
VKPTLARPSPVRRFEKTRVDPKSSHSVPTSERGVVANYTHRSRCPHALTAE